MTNWSQRRKWIVQYIRERNRLSRISWPVDVLNAEFVEAYIRATEARFYPMPYGAHKCPQLGRDLKRLYDEGSLSRHRTGIAGFAGQGFPTWVWMYKLVDWMEGTEKRC